jgi:hypothetical protein
MKISKIGFFTIVLILTAFSRISPLYGADASRAPIDVNLIIDSSGALTNVRDDVIAWVSNHLIDQILTEGDNVTVWSAGTAARVVYSGRITGNSDKEALRRSIQTISASGTSADFLGALQDAAGRSAQPASGINYTLLICGNPGGLSTLLSGPHASLLRFSRVKEFPGWRALVVGINFETRVRQAAVNFMSTQ